MNIIFLIELKLLNLCHLSEPVNVTSGVPQGILLDEKFTFKPHLMDGWIVRGGVALVGVAKRAQCAPRFVACILVEVVVWL
jgi:hypothetical protein